MEVLDCLALEVSGPEQHAWDSGGHLMIWLARPRRLPRAALVLRPSPAYRLRAELGAASVHSQITYFAPYDPGYVLDVSGAAILKSSRNKADAQKFLAFLVSRQGQEIIAHSTSFEYPLADGVQTAAPETPFSQLKPNSITIPELGDGAEAIALLRKAGML